MGKTTIILVRHGQSEANLTDTFAGHSGYSLTPLGREQAARTAAYIKETYPVDAVFSSDLPRAFQTAEYIARAFGLPITTDAHFREIFAGDWEGVQFDQLTEQYPTEFAVWQKDIGNARCTNGESVSEVIERVYNGLLGIAENGKCIVVATHATPLRSVYGRLRMMLTWIYKPSPGAAIAPLASLYWKMESLPLSGSILRNTFKVLKQNCPRMSKKETPEIK